MFINKKDVRVLGIPLWLPDPLVRSLAFFFSSFFFGVAYAFLKSSFYSFRWLCLRVLFLFFSYSLSSSGSSLSLPLFSWALCPPLPFLRFPSYSFPAWEASWRGGLLALRAVAFFLSSASPLGLPSAVSVALRFFRFAS